MKTTQLTHTQYFTVLAIANTGILPIAEMVSIQRFQHLAWMIVILAYLMSIVILLLVLYLCNSFQEKSLIEWSKMLLGKWVGGLYATAAIAVVYIWGLLVYADHWNFLIYAHFKNTSPYVWVLFLVPTVVYAVSNGLSSWSRMFVIIGLLVLCGFLLTGLPQFKNGHWDRLLPFSNTTNNQWSLRDTISVVFFFHGFILIYFLHPHMRAIRKLKRYSAAALTLSFLVVLSTVLMPLTVFDGRTAADFSYPYLDSISSIALTILPMEKIDFILTLIVLALTMCMMIITLHCTLDGIHRLFPRMNPKWIIIVLGCISAFFGSREFSNANLRIWSFYWSEAAIVLFLVIPVVLWLVMRMRKMGKSHG